VRSIHERVLLGIVDRDVISALRLVIALRASTVELPKTRVLGQTLDNDSCFAWLMKRRLSTLTLVLAGSLCLGTVLYGQKEAPLSASESKIMISALRDSYAAFNRGDIDAALKPLDPDIEWSEPQSFPGGGTYHGLAGVKSYLTESRAGLAEGTSEPEEFLPVGSRIVVFVHAHVRPKGSSGWQDVKLADVYTIRNGKAIQMRAFADRQQALNWVRGKSPD
jgi:uncharacterized protein